MYSDRTLTPKEAARLCVLGTLSSGPLPYSKIATSARHFIERILGPSLDVMGTSIELLKFEGLVQPIDGEGFRDDATLEMTSQGREELLNLLMAPVRAQSNDMNSLITALKFRFLHLLPADDQVDQVDTLLEAAEKERARLNDLRTTFGNDGSYLLPWLDRQIDELDGRISWLLNLEDTLQGITE